MGINDWWFVLYIVELYFLTPQAEIRDFMAEENPTEKNASLPFSPPDLTTYFVTENGSSVTAQTGSTALLGCVIYNNMADGTVSWIRRKDHRLLTVGLTTYTGDERFQTVHVQHSEDWTLQIKYVQKRDAGLYECQVSSHPPSSIFVDLNVIEAKAEILGPSEKYVNPGSKLKLQCFVLRSTEHPTYIFWYHNNRMINYDSDRGVNVSTDLYEKNSVLTVYSTSNKNTGNYSCVPSNSQPASIYVHILDGEIPAAMQHGGHGSSWPKCNSSYWLLLVIISSFMVIR